jgi:hypothetical protein
LGETRRGRGEDKKRNALAFRGEQGNTYLIRKDKDKDTINKIAI